MSYLQGFNYSYGIPSLPGAFSNAPFQISSRFAPQQNAAQQQQQYTNGPTPPGANIPIPESIIPNPQSYIDYYGNPQQQQQGQNNPVANEIPQNIDPQQYYNNNDNHQNYQQPLDYQPQPPVQQSGRKRRPKNGRARNAQALSYGQEQVQQFQNFNSVQNPQQNPLPSGSNNFPRVTPIQGPIYAKNGLLPVVPLYSYPHAKNGTFYQIPILWTALSYALGLEIRGEILRGLPCIKRLNQLFCPTAGNTYPLDNIEQFIDQNKALIKRMYGEFAMSSDAYASPLGGNSLRRSTREVFEDEVPDILGKPKPVSVVKRDVDSGSVVVGNATDVTGHVRTARQTVNPRNGGPTQQPKSNRVDSCESTVEITTPYWAANSAGKVRAIVNTQHFEQAIHQEVCAKTSTKRCIGDCGCEQKYKWHRLLAYDPDNDCRGIFMDWFLFPSCCVCRCNPLV